MIKMSVHGRIILKYYKDEIIKEHIVGKMKTY